MKSISVRYALIAMILLTVCMTWADGVIAQNTDRNIERLRWKYHWGSIYLTYGPICDITQRLSDEEVFRKLSSQDNGSAIPKLATFLARNRSKSMRDGIAFIQINLDAREAGYMKSGDRNGVINKIAWDQDDVIKIAYWCDLFLTAAEKFLDYFNNTTSPGTSLNIAWASILAAQNNIFIPKEKISLLLTEFRLKLDSESNALKDLETKDAKLFATLTKFKDSFDSAILNRAINSNQRQQSVGYEGTSLKTMLRFRSVMLHSDLIYPNEKNPYENDETIQFTKDLQQVLDNTLKSNSGKP